MSSPKRVNASAIPLKFKKLVPEAHAPSAVGNSSAFLLKSSVDTIVPAHKLACVATGLSIEIPHGTYAQLVPLESLAVKGFVDVGAGVIDSDYRGEVKVVLMNHGDEDLELKAGDSIAQMIVLWNPEVDVSEATDELRQTERNTGGFGSSGIN